jgi:hypothetical protein
MQGFEPKKNILPPSGPPIPTVVIFGMMGVLPNVIYYVKFGGCMYRFN